MSISRSPSLICTSTCSSFCRFSSRTSSKIRRVSSSCNVASAAAISNWNMSTQQIGVATADRTPVRVLSSASHWALSSTNTTHALLFHKHRHLSSTPTHFEGPWYEKFLIFQDYKSKNGDSLVPERYVDGGVKLGAWVKIQRKLYKQGKLSKSRRELLDGIGFSWDPVADRWERNFVLLLQFKKREGHCNVPYSHKENGTKLGAWLCRQRYAKKKGTLDELYRQRLEAADVSWEPLADQWEESFGLLLQYKEREGHCNIPQHHREEGANLGHWLDRTRQAKKKGKLDESHQRRLEAIGVSWNRKEDQWEDSFALLLQYKEREGHCNIPLDHQEDGVKLGRWLDNLRQAKKESKLNESRISNLEEVGVSWSPYADQWEQNFALLLQYKEREGHCNVPQKYHQNGTRLGRWVSAQREVKKGKKQGILDSDRIRRLDELGMQWDLMGDNH